MTSYDTIVFMNVHYLSISEFKWSQHFFGTRFYQLFIFANFNFIQAVVELKNKPTMWHKAKKVSLTAGQTDIKIEFPLPIVACNLMIEYADYYENIQVL